jgi:hypothetical protein
MFVDVEKSMAPWGVARNSGYTRRTWRLDVGDGVEGFVVDGWRRVRRVRYRIGLALKRNIVIAEISSCNIGGHLRLSFLGKFALVS